MANVDEDDAILGHNKYTDMVSEYGVPEEFCPVCRQAITKLIDFYTK